MRIFGIGTDIVHVKRIEDLYAQYEDKFVKRILSLEEQNQFRNVLTPIHYLAKRFAAKEAIAKALGTGIGASIAFNEISVLNHPTGSPYVDFDGKGRRLMTKLNIQSVQVSLSDETEYCVAFAIATTY